jgi:hypothetical protein
MSRVKFVPWVLLAWVAVLGGRLSGAAATWPSQMNFQGQLTDNSGLALADGPYSIKFTLYTAASGGSALWTETETVNLTKGLFNAVLGSVNPLSGLGLSNYNNDLWVGVTVGADPEMTPRQQLLPAPYARNAQALGGLLPNNSPNNLVVLDASGKVPAGLVQGGSLSAPLDLSGGGAPYVLSLGNSGAGVLGVSVTASNGALLQALDPAGYAIWGQTAPGDAVTAIGVRGGAGAGIGVLAQSLSGLALSATTQSSTKPALYAAGVFPARLAVSTAAPGGVGLALSTPNDDQDVNLVDRGNKAGLWANVSAVSTFGVSATAASGSGVFGATASGSLSDYGVWGANQALGTGVFGTGLTGVAGVSSVSGGFGVAGYNSGSGAGVGVEGFGSTGVQGQATVNNGRGVEGDVPATVSGAFAVLGVSNYVTGVAMVGRHLGTGAGTGVRGSSANGVGATGVFGTVSGAAAIGVVGFGSATDAYGVEGVQGSNAPSASVAGVYGKTNSLALGTGVRGEGFQGVYGLSNGYCGVCGLNQSTTDGNAAGYFQAQGTSGVIYGVHAATASPSGVNFYSDTAGSPAFGFYHYDPTPALGSRVGVYSASNCGTCIAGDFINPSATDQDGSAVTVEGRLRVIGSAGSFTAPASALTYTLSNSYIPADGNCLIFMTVASATSSVAAVTAKGNGSATITFTPALAANTTYQYMIIGQ